MKEKERKSSSVREWFTMGNSASICVGRLVEFGWWNKTEILWCFATILQLLIGWDSTRSHWPRQSLFIYEKRCLFCWFHLSLSVESKKYLFVSYQYRIEHLSNAKKTRITNKCLAYSRVGVCRMDKRHIFDLNSSVLMKGLRYFSFTNEIILLERRRISWFEWTNDHSVNWERIDQIIRININSEDVTVLDSALFHGTEYKIDGRMELR